MRAAEETADALMAAMRERDFETFGEALAPDVVLHSPITGRFSFEGREDVVGLVRIVRDGLEDFRPVGQFGDGDTRAVMFEAKARGVPLQGLDVLRFDAEGRVRELRVFIRPLPGLAALAAVLGPPVARRGGKVRGALVGPPMRLQAFMARVGDKVALRILQRSFRRPTG